MTRILFAAAVVLAFAATADAQLLRRRAAACENGSCADAVLVEAVPKPLAAAHDVRESPKPLARVRQGFAPVRAIRAIWWLLHPGILRNR